MRSNLTHVSHFTDKEMEENTDDVDCPRSWSSSVTQLTLGILTNGGAFPVSSLGLAQWLAIHVPVVS